MKEIVTFGVLDENGEITEMPEQMARYLATYRDDAGSRWYVWQRVDQIGEWEAVKPS